MTKSSRQLVTTGIRSRWHPKNAAAKEGLERTVERIKQLGVREAKRGDLNAAERYLRQALEVQPDSAELRRIERRLKAAKAKRLKKLQKD